MNAGRLARLRQHLTVGAASPFVWGRCDCSLWPCDWIAGEVRIDPAAHLRGTYHDALSCARLLKREGGLPALAASLAVTAGLARTADPVPGDVGVIETRIGAFLMLNCSGSGWAWKTRDGVLFGSAAPLMAWSV
ncbi:hypothetical protein FPV16_09770 [Methylobacterium sp. W2]|uniref:DUF6950 family protein n=1 Tax=Methylobacterium sp. W2 TaxID=2598107 RepID=UPI001D0C5C00|nr:hypothetical protein [Methylobacterium sp. W2]MCC0806502.1 hypothetical protein [Methylobacterium sp. W2]